MYNGKDVTNHPENRLQELENDLHNHQCSRSSKLVPELAKRTEGKLWKSSKALKFSFTEIVLV
jgi:hypothetical protein